MKQKDLEEILDRRPGKGMIIGGRVGDKEVVDFKERIGRWVNKESGESIPTSLGVIHYDKAARAHIIPANPQILKTKESEEITEDGLRTIACCAMLGSIRPNIREIYIEFDKAYKQIDLYTYFDTMPTDDEIEDISCIESEMLSDCTLEYTFNYQIFHLPYPAQSQSRGMCVYRRYEPNPEPEPVTQKTLLVAATKAMLGHIHPNLREIDLIDDEEFGKVDVRAYFDRVPSDNQVQDIASIVADMKWRFSPDLSWKTEIIVLPFPEKTPKHFSIYRRHE